MEIKARRGNGTEVEGEKGEEGDKKGGRKKVGFHPPRDEKEGTGGLWSLDRTGGGSGV